MEDLTEAGQVEDLKIAVMQDGHPISIGHGPGIALTWKTI
jgi:hypothetical protein